MDPLAEALRRAQLDVDELLREAEALARADVVELLRAGFRDEVLRRATERLGAGDEVVALVGVAEGVTPLVRRLPRGALQDERRLEQEVRAHNELLQDALVRGAVIPFRFGVTFEQEEQVHRWVAEHHDALALELDRLRGTSEWSVRFVAAGGEEPAAGEYLERRLATAVRPEATQRLALIAADVAGDAYLVADADVPEFQAALADLGEQGYALEVSGPWPAYSFARLP